MCFKGMFFHSTPPQLSKARMASGWGKVVILHLILQEKLEALYQDVKDRGGGGCAALSHMMPS